MDITTLLGILIGLFLIINGIGFEDVENFIDISSILVVVGGTCSVIVASYPVEMLFDIPNHIKVLFRRNKYNMFQLVDQLVELSEVPRRDGILALEDRTDEIHHPFLKKGILMILDTNDSKKVKFSLEREIYNMELRHDKVIELYEGASAYAPAFGMVGTLIGLIDMLKQLDMNLTIESSTLGYSMSLALITTFYGCILSNLLFHPIAKKLRIRQDEEMLYCNVIIEGIIAIHKGEAPQAIRDRLVCYLKKKEQKKYYSRIKNNRITHH